MGTWFLIQKKMVSEIPFSKFMNAAVIHSTEQATLPTGKIAPSPQWKGSNVINWLSGSPDSIASCGSGLFSVSGI